MPLQITIQNAQVFKIEIANHNDGAYFQVGVSYHLKDDLGQIWSLKDMNLFSAASGLGPSQLLPAAWETTFANLISEIETKLDTIEGLT